MGIYSDGLLEGVHVNNASDLFNGVNVSGQQKRSGCLKIKRCCHDPNAVMAPLQDLKINRTIKLWSPCSLNFLVDHINLNGGKRFCLFRMKNSKACARKNRSCMHKLEIHIIYHLETLYTINQLISFISFVIL